MSGLNINPMIFQMSLPCSPTEKIEHLNLRFRLIADKGKWGVGCLLSTPHFPLI